MDVFTIFLGTIFVNNIVLAQYLGCCPFLGCSKQRGVALGMGAAVMFVTVLATLCTWLIQRLLLNTLGLEYLQTIAFILVIASLVQLVEMFLKKMVPPLYKSLGIFLPLITTNCAVLGVTILNIDSYSADAAGVGFGYAYAEAMVCAVGAGVGFLLAMVLFAGVRARLQTAKTPKCFDGLPITLVAAAIVSLSFMGFGGVIENIFKV